MNLEDQIREIVADTVRTSVLEVLDEVELAADPSGADESWRSRLHRVHESTRLDLEAVAEALGVSERTVRRYLKGNGKRPELPHRRGPTGFTVRAGDLRTWIEDVEGANRFHREDAA